MNALRVPLLSVFSPVVLGAGIGLGALAAACDKPPSDSDLREWTPADHDRVEEKQRIAQGAQPQPGQSGGGGNAANGEAIIEATWKQQCATCHGAAGKGDGPNAPMFKPADLTREEWQAKVTDEELAAVIKNGKNKMPKFDLPDPIVQGVIARIRFYRGK